MRKIGRIICNAIEALLVLFSFVAIFGALTFAAAWLTYTAVSWLMRV